MMKCVICNSTVHEHTLCKSTVAGYRCKTKSESVAQPLFELKLMLCPNCMLLSQKSYAEATPLLAKLYEEHPSTQHSTAVRNPYFINFVDNAITKYRLSQKSRVLEIGCNCATLVALFRDKCGANVTGVEPSKALTESWAKNGVDVINAYFNEETARKLRESGEFDLIFFRHVLEHVPQPCEFIAGVSTLLSDKGVVIVEVPYLGTVLSKARIENVSYSHVHHYCIRSLDALLSQSGLGIVDYSLEDTDGGAIVVHASKGSKTNPTWLEDNLEHQLVAFLAHHAEMKFLVKQTLKKYPNGSVVGYGAGAKGQHLIHALELEDALVAVIDDTPGLAGMYIPGTHLRIESRDFLNNNIAAVVNLAPTHSEAIRRNVPEEIDFIDFVNR